MHGYLLFKIDPAKIEGFKPAGEGKKAERFDGTVLEGFKEAQNTSYDNHIRDMGDGTLLARLGLNFDLATGRLTAEDHQVNLAFEDVTIKCWVPDPDGRYTCGIWSPMKNVHVGLYPNSTKTDVRRKLIQIKATDLGAARKTLLQVLEGKEAPPGPLMTLLLRVVGASGHTSRWAA